MKLIIIGGGKLGFFLAKVMKQKGHYVRLIEIDKKKCGVLATRLDAIVLYGNGTDLKVLEKAKIEDCDAMIAVSGRDEDNVVACQIAKKLYEVPTVIARVNNPKNLETMKRLGADIAVCNTEIISKIIEQEVDSQGLHLLASLNKGQASIVSAVIEKNSSINGKTMKEIGMSMPKDSLIISLVRDNKSFIPKGDTIILGGDEVIAVCGAGMRKDLLKALK